MGECSGGEGCCLSVVTTEAGAEMPGPWKAWENDEAVFPPSHRPWKSIMPISTFPCHDYDEDEYILKPAGLRDTHSEGKVMSMAHKKSWDVMVENWKQSKVTTLRS